MNEEERLDVEWERLYAIRNDGDRDFMLEEAIREKWAVEKRLAECEERSEKTPD